MFASLLLAGCLIASEPSLIAPGATEVDFDLAADADVLAPFDIPADATADSTTEEEAETDAIDTPITEEEESTEHIELSPEMAELRAVVREAIEGYQPRILNTRDHNPWELMHGYVAWGVDTLVRRGGPEGDPVNALSYVAINGACKGQRLLRIENGRIAVDKGPGVQGHYGQFLAILAQSRVPTDYPLTADGQTFTVADLIESEKLGCKSGMELTFKLISLSYYLPSEETWKNAEGEEWSIGRLAREEIAAPIHTAACGGTHRLMGLSYAVHHRRKQGLPIDGEFARADKYTRDYQDWAFKLQNPDGSFSTAWLKRREDRQDLGRKLQTSGHILEWLAFSLPAERLQSPEVYDAVAFLAVMLADNPQRQWEIGPLGHGMHALLMYDRRVFGGVGSYVQPIESAEPETEPAAAPLAGGP